MSNAVITVQATIIHRIIKAQHQVTPTPPVIRKQLHASKQQVVKLIDFLDDLLDKNGLAHSHASTFDSVNTVSNILNEYLIKNVNVPAENDEDTNVCESETLEETRYRRITNQLTHALHFHIYKDPMTTGDHLPLIFYRQNDNDYLYIALLSLTDSITIDEDTGHILDTTRIDSKALKVAFKINITQMKAHADSFSDEAYASSNYVSWVQKGSSDKIVEYIQDYIPVMFRVDDKNATTKLMKTLNNYLSTSKFNIDVREEINSDVIKLLRRKAADKQPINIVEDIDPIIDNKSAQYNITDNSFKLYRETNGYSTTDKNASNVFSPANDPLNNFEKFDIFIGAENSLKISGNQSDLRHKINLVDDDPDNIRLEISLTPEDVKKIKRIINKSTPYESDPE